MKFPSFRATACLIIIGVQIFCVTGCKKPDPISKHLEDAAVLKGLETKTGMKFPEYTMIVSSYLGERDASHEYQSWLLLSPDAFEMPPMKETYIDKYLHLPFSLLNDFVKEFEALMRGRKIRNPQSAFSSRWDKGDYTFKGVVVRSGEGEYLKLEQFRNSNSKPSTSE